MRVHITITDEKGIQYAGEANLAKMTSQKHNSGKTKPHTNNLPSTAVRQLCENGFFKDNKKLADIVSNMKSSGFNFKKGSIIMALKGAEYLIRTGEKGKFHFIQKYPYS